MTLFTLGNSSDAFLLLRAREAGVGETAIPLLWAALHIVKSTSSLAGGVLSDGIGRRGAITAGWMVYAAVYAGFAVVSSAWQACGAPVAFATGAALAATAALLLGLLPGLGRRP